MTRQNERIPLRKVILRALPLVWPCYPKLAYSFLMAITLVYAALWSLVTAAQQRFFDAAAEASSGAPMAVFWQGLALIGGTYLMVQAVTWLLAALANYIWPRIETRLRWRMQDKAARVEPVCFEDAARLDDIEKAADGSMNAALLLHSMVYALAHMLGYFGVMGVYLFILQPILALAIPLVFIPTLLAYVLRAKAHAELADIAGPQRRRSDYYESALAGRELLKETRLLGAFGYFIRLMRDSLRLMANLSIKTQRRSTLLALGANLFTVVGYLGILGLCFHFLMAGSITVGAFSAIYISVGRMFSMMQGDIDCFRELTEYAGPARNFIEFMEMPERKSQTDDLPVDSGVKLENVSFRYPGGERDAVSGVTAEIHDGETVAIVGENGSGKTTLVRLLLGLYVPGEGRVLRGGVDTALMPLDAVRRGASAVFQKFQKYPMTLRENIRISDTSHNGDDAELDAVGRQAGCDAGADCYPQGYDTMLSREFGGAELSGGQWQRVAIGRGLYRPHRFIVLDEPTAAIDPLEETRIYNRFAEVSRDKTAVIVTHRLGSVRLANRILVMKEGRLVEEGNHDQLMAAGGEYARIYESQRKWYEE